MKKGNGDDMFQDCENDQYNYKIAEEYTGATKYVCKRCGKIKYESILSSIEHPENANESEYIILDPNSTTIFYSNTLRLTVESIGKTIEFEKEIVNVGRDPASDFQLAGKIYVARRHATFFYEREMWFLRDNNSANGTWINDTKLQPGKKYQLAANDVINFAMSEKVIFYKHTQPVQPTADTDSKAIAFLELSMETFAKT